MLIRDPALTHKGTHMLDINIDATSKSIIQNKNRTSFTGYRNTIQGPFGNISLMNIEYGVVHKCYEDITSSR